MDLAERTIGVGLGGLQRLRLRLPRHRLRRVAPRPRARGRDRRPPRPARRVRLHLPGRRRPGRDRHRRDRPRRGARRAHQRHLRQQRHLRHDRWPDGPDDAARPAHDLEPGRAARPASRATPSRSPRCSRCCRASTYAARGSIADPGWIGRTKAMLRRSFEIQLAGAGFSIVEILSTCPVGWGMTPDRGHGPCHDDVPAVYPLGVIVDRGREGGVGDPPTHGADHGGLTDDIVRLQRVRRPGHPVRRASPRGGGVLEGRDVSWMPSYGPEMRGGTASY